MAKTGVILILMMLQVCHGRPADPGCGISTEVVMIDFTQKHRFVLHDILSRVPS